MEKQKCFNPDKMLGHKFRLASVGIDKFFRSYRSVPEDEVPRGQGGLLGYLVNHQDQEIYQKDLEQVFHISGATASNMLKSLEKSGMIERIPASKDARLKRLVVTEKALHREERIRQKLLYLEEHMLEGFSEEEKVQVFDMLERIVQNIRKLTKDGADGKETEQDT